MADDKTKTPRSRTIFSYSFIHKRALFIGLDNYTCMLPDDPAELGDTQPQVDQAWLNQLNECFHNQNSYGYQIIAVDESELSSSYREVQAAPSSSPAQEAPACFDTFNPSDLQLPASTPSPVPTGSMSLSGRIEDTDEFSVSAALVSSNFGITKSDQSGVCTFQGVPAPILVSGKWRRDRVPASLSYDCIS
jgi:hypothetical protein